jgi:hypothetical protein
MRARPSTWGRLEFGLTASARRVKPGGPSNSAHCPRLVSQLSEMGCRRDQCVSKLATGCRPSGSPRHRAVSSIVQLNVVICRQKELGVVCDERVDNTKGSISYCIPLTNPRARCCLTMLCTSVCGRMGIRNEGVSASSMHLQAWGTKGLSPCSEQAILAGSQAHPIQ